MTGAAKYVANFVADELLDFLSGGAEVLARIELLRSFREDLADAGGQSQAQIGVDIDLGATGAASDFDIAFGNTLSTGQCATVLINFLHQMLRNGRSTVENQGEIAQACIHESGLNRFEAFEVQVLLTGEFVGTVGVANGYGQRISSGGFDKFDGFGRTGIDAGGIEFAGVFAFIMLRAD